jgi:hypothetical protein
MGAVFAMVIVGFGFGCMALIWAAEQCRRQAQRTETESQRRDD